MLAISGDERAARESIRISFGRTTTKQEIERAASQLVEAVSSIRTIQEDYQ
jgi:cysteine sulfinate desulfinase/cysteine desulfurase-like protein